MKLYYSPGTCSLAAHIVLREAGLAFDLIQVDIGSHKTAAGSDYLQINQKGSVPVLEFEDGSRLTEGPIICQYLADQAEKRSLMPAAGTLERYRVMEWQNYITSELHKFFWPLFNLGEDQETTKAVYRKKLSDKFNWVSKQLGAGPYLTGENFTAADAYLFTVANWSRMVNVDLTGATDLGEFMGRVAQRPAVRQAMLAEGLITQPTAKQTATA